MNHGAVLEHYRANWGECRHAPPPFWRLSNEFSVLVFPPRTDRDMWTYATVGMAHEPEAGRRHGLEIHLFAPGESAAHVELLAAIADYHLSGAALGLGHTVNFGRPWLEGSRCSYGLISLPYLDGPPVEWLRSDTGDVRCLWLIAITGAERNFVIESGVEALEEAFEREQFDYLDPLRSSVK